MGSSGICSPSCSARSSTDIRPGRIPISAVIATKDNTGILKGENSSSDIGVTAGGGLAVAQAVAKKGNNIIYTVALNDKELNPYCIDVSSSVETNGFKDYKKMEEFIRRVRQ